MVRHTWYDEERNLVIAKSDSNLKIQKVGTSGIYDEAIDLFDHYDAVDNTPRGRYEFVETDMPIIDE